MASTIKDFTEELRDTYKALKDEAQNALAQATQDLTNAKKDYDDKLKEFTDLEQTIADKRAAMSTALMPADIEVLAEQMRNLILQLRKKRVELLDAQEALAAAEQKRDLTEAQLKRASSDSNEAEAELKVAKVREDRHTEWKKMVDDGVLSDLADATTALLDAASDAPAEDDVEAIKNIKAATSRINTDIPADLRTRSRERQEQTETDLSSNHGLLKNMEDELGGHRNNAEGASGLIAQQWITFERAEEAFKDLVVLSKSRYTQALSLLKSVAESTELTQAEKDRIAEVTLSDGDEEAPGEEEPAEGESAEGESAEEALTKEKARDSAQAAVDAKKIEIELAIAKARIVDIDADPEVDETVIAKREELNELNITLAEKESEYTQVMRDHLDLWEAAVPDHIWANLVAYDQAIALLQGIKNGDPGALSAAMEATESSLVEALKAEDKTVRTSHYLEDSIESLNKRFEFMRKTHQEWVLSGARGDN